MKMILVASMFFLTLAAHADGCRDRVVQCYDIDGNLVTYQSANSCQAYTANGKTGYYGVCTESPGACAGESIVCADPNGRNVTFPDCNSCDSYVDSSGSIGYRGNCH